MALGEVKSGEWKKDNDFEEYTIQEVDLDRDEGERGTWVVKVDFGFELHWPRGGGAPQPKVGQVVRVFGNVEHAWGPRGVVIEDKVAFFRTIAEHEEWMEQREEEAYREAVVLFREREPELRERFGLLPEELRQRIEAARAVVKDKERFDVFEFEVEIIKHEHAHMIALVMDNEATFETFSLIPNQNQMGYSWNAMCVERLAAIDKMLKGSDASEDTFAQLRQEAKFLKRYADQRFITQHPLEVLREIFDIAADLVQAKIRH